MKFILLIISLAYFHLTNCKLTASFKETSFHGLDDLNINFIKSFQLSGFTLGFKKNIKNMNDILKSPDTLFYKKVTNFFSNNLHIDGDLDVANNILKVSTKLVNHPKKILLNFSGSSKNKLTDIEFRKDFTKLSLNLFYNLPKKLLSTSTSYKVDTWNAIINLDYDTSNKDPIISVVKHVDDANELIPSMSFKTKLVTYAWKHKWNGSSLTSTLIPDDSIELVWKDIGYNGNWNTKGSLSLKDSSKNKLSISREWNV